MPIWESTGQAAELNSVSVHFGVTCGSPMNPVGVWTLRRRRVGSVSPPEPEKMPPLFHSVTMLRSGCPPAWVSLGSIAN